MLEAPQVVAIDMNESKLAVARTLGATATVNAAPDCAEQVRDLTGGGVAYAFEMAGSAKALGSYRITRRGG
jgi:alcohol dehydrogenase